MNDTVPLVTLISTLCVFNVNPVNTCSSFTELKALIVFDTLPLILISTEPVPGYSDRYFNENGYCWANELRDYLVEKFNGEQIVGLNHDEIKPLKRIPVTTYDGNAISSYNTNVDVI